MDLLVLGDNPGEPFKVNSRKMVIYGSIPGNACWYGPGNECNTY